MRVKKCIADIWKEIIFTIVMIIYLVRLNALNEELNFYDFDNPFALLRYNDFAPIKFFIVAMVLFSIGSLLVYRKIRYLRRKCDSFEEIIITFLAIAITIVLLILLFVFIDNPILRAVFTSIFVILGFFNIAE